jgi:hypothetical protein
MIFINLWHNYCTKITCIRNLKKKNNSWGVVNMYYILHDDFSIVICESIDVVAEHLLKGLTLHGYCDNEDKLKILVDDCIDRCVSDYQLHWFGKSVGE